MEDGELRFEDIKEAVRNKKRMKIYTIDDLRKDSSEDMLFRTGFITDSFEIGSSKAVHMKPYVGINISCDCEELFFKDTTDTVTVTLETNGSRIYSVSNKFDTHVLKSKPLVKDVCDEETKFFKKYLKFAKELYVFK